jgi:hypothetical protein
VPFPTAGKSPLRRITVAPVAVAVTAALTLAGCGSGGGAHAISPTTTANPAATSTSQPSTGQPATSAAATTSSAPSATSSAPSATSGPPSVAPATSTGRPGGGTGGPRKPVPVTRAVHITGAAWAYKPKHDAVMALLKAHRINAIEVDIKDESGLVNYASSVPLATTVGAVDKQYDVKKMLAEIHAAGGRVIGREVAFNDPKLAKWAWLNGHRDEVLQTTAHQPWQGSYGAYAFTNFANTDVQNYNIDLAVEAAKLGFDDVLYDYVRRPDGKLSAMYIPGLTGTPEQGVASFVANTRKAFTQAGVSTFIGASVFGIAATRPKEIAQDISLMAPYLDYVAPMVYPSHWGNDEYGLHNPVAEPYKIVQRSLVDFQKKVKGTSATVVPWLQAFSLGGVTYGPTQVLAQEKAAHDDGLDGFLLWNAGANYVAADLPTM